MTLSDRERELGFMDYDALVKWANDPVTKEKAESEEFGYRRGFTHALYMMCDILDKAKSITEAKDLTRRSANVASYFSHGHKREEKDFSTIVVESLVKSGEGDE